MKLEDRNSTKNVNLVNFESRCSLDKNFSKSEFDSVKSLKPVVDPQFQKFCSKGFLCKNDDSCR